jgi:CheY-like chemotaxis protein
MMVNEANMKSIGGYRAPVLLVEDDPDHARLVKKALKEHGRLPNDIYWVKNGGEAIEYITRTGHYSSENGEKVVRPALVLLDIRMPLMDGFEVLKKIKNSKESRTIPVVMLTCTGFAEDIKRAMELGANDYIVKPGGFKDFAQKMGKLGYYWGSVSDARIGLFTD